MNRRDSFTLVELLMVMFVIVILSGAVFSSVGYVNRKAAEAKTQALLAKVAIALEAYKADWGEYPLARSNMWARGQVNSNFNSVMMSNLAGLYAGEKKYIDFAADETNMVVAGGAVRLFIVDGFGSPIAYDPVYTNTNTRGTPPNGRVNFKSYDLWSFGADLKSAAQDPSLSAVTFQDDLKNWD
jgi:type II secretory pathway pseudopilin PulG